jgi:ABC-type branched-subunit amino acid transport system ATPase component
VVVLDRGRAHRRRPKSVQANAEVIRAYLGTKAMGKKAA